MSRITPVTTEALFERTALSPAVPSLVLFYAADSPDCQRLTGTFEALHNEYGEDVRFATVDVDEAPDLAAAYHIGKLPTAIFFRDGRKMQRWIDEQDAAAYRTVINAHLPQHTL